MTTHRPDPHEDLLDRATEALCHVPVPLGPPPEVRAELVEALQKASSPLEPSTILSARNFTMKSVMRLATAAAILLVAGVAFVWFSSGGGSSGIALAKVANALDAVRSATFTMKGDFKDPASGREMSMVGKGMYQAPGRQRMETAVGTEKSVMVMDQQAGKGLMLMPAHKLAVVIDAEKMLKQVEKGQGPRPDTFEMVRQLVREGSVASGEKVESLGRKEMEGHQAVGFRFGNPMGKITIWADAQTAQPVRFEMVPESMPEGQVVMDDFRFDVDLDASLFRIEPPEGYTVQNLDMGVPTEEHLIQLLRVIAEHQEGMFPKTVGMSKEFFETIGTLIKPEMEKLVAKYGKDSPELMKAVLPLQQKYTQGVMFYMTLQPANDPHYVGGGVKLNTPDRPILWYKPTGSEKYRVVYADLHVAEMDAEAVAKFPQAAEK